MAGEQEAGGQTGIPEPFRLARKDTGCYEGVVSTIGTNRKLACTASASLLLLNDTCIYRDPGPYCPDTGQAQITSQAGRVALGGVELDASDDAAAVRLLNVARSPTGVTAKLAGNTGDISRRGQTERFLLTTTGLGCC
ncbi:hypothetical protein PG984_014111 [Apiospora sp. TS-2023a]